MDKGHKQQLDNPRRNANIFSIVTFSWLFNVFRVGFGKKLENSDLYTVLPQHSTEILNDRIFKPWKRQKIKLEKKNSKEYPRLFTVLAQCFGREFSLNIICMILGKIVFRGCEPLLLIKVLSFFKDDEKYLKEEAYYWTTGLLVVKIIIAILIHQFYMIQAFTAMKLKVACSALIYNKILRISKCSTGNDTSVGQIINLLSHDVRTLELVAIYIYYLVHSPLQIFVFTWIIYWKLGIASVIGVSINLLTIPAQVYIGNWVGYLMGKSVVQTDKRLSFMNEIISGIQIIKMYAWEKPFSFLVDRTRQKETHEIKKMFIVGAIIQTTKMYIPQLCIFSTILICFALGTKISVESVYMLISFNTQIREDFCYLFTRAIQLLTKANVSAKRIEAFLKSPERRENTTKHPSENMNKKPSVNLLEIGAKWSSDSQEETLKDITLTLEDGQLIAIIGQVASGKSSLLQVLLGELPLSSGKIQVQGQISYASQEPWVFASTIRQNILFGQPMTEERYEKVISVCQLKQDFASLPFGDQTLIGEKGIKLSGGQKARINLARAVYSEGDIYLFDDPLSAVDPEVGKRIFEDCICGFLQNKIRILVTHQLQYLQRVDQVIVLSKGSLQQKGTLDQLLESDLDFVKILQHAEQKNDDVKSIQSAENTLLSTMETSVEEEEISELKNITKYSKGVFWYYLKSVENVWIVLLAFVLGFTYQTFLSGNEYVLSRWMNAEEKMSVIVRLNDTLPKDLESQRQWYIEIYSILLGAAVLSVTAFCFVFFDMCLRAAKGLHRWMFHRVIRAPMLFFHENSSGRILNRFSKDISTIDKEFPEYMEDIVQVVLQLLAVIVITGFFSPWSLILLLLMGTMCYLLHIIYIRTSHSIKILEAANRSPVFNHVNATFNGLITIRAQKATESLRNEFNNHQDLNTSAQFLFQSVARCYGFYIEITALLTVLSVVYLLITFNKGIQIADAGLVILQCFQMCADLQWAMQQTAEFQNQLTAVERILEYTDLDQEPSFDTRQDVQLSKRWPSRGQVTFKNVSLRYHPKGATVLKNLDFTVLPKEKIAIVGRTGAGKSSLIAALFRLAYIEGDIYIDDMETSSLGLHDLRSKISIIPQQPLLFAGTLRRNLDPFDEYSDLELWQALEDVELKNILKTNVAELNIKISDEGSNFSVGERQLLSLARAILRNNRILVLDEATANVDLQTDELIQKTIRRRFKDCTVFTIAHRLNTVMDCDKFIVMDKGSVVEFNHPHLLMQNKNGFLYKMIQQSGSDIAKVLAQTAEKMLRIENI